MIYRKGELSPASIDRGWPHQVVLPASACEQGGYKEIHEFCKNLSICSRGHSVFHEDRWFNVYCFAEASDAENFMKQFGGERSIRANEGKEAAGRVGRNSPGSLYIRHVWPRASLLRLFRNQDFGSNSILTIRRRISRPTGTSHRPSRCSLRSAPKTESASPR